MKLLRWIKSSNRMAGPHLYPKPSVKSQSANCSRYWKENVRSGCNRILCLVTASIGREYDELGKIFTSEWTGRPLSSTSINSRGYKVRFSILYVERIVMILVMSTTETSQRRRVGNLSTRGLREYTYSPSRSTGIPRSCSHGLSTNSTPMLCCPRETFYEVSLNGRRMVFVEGSYLAECPPVIKPPIYCLALKNLGRFDIFDVCIGLDIRPDVDCGSGLVANSIRRICSACLLEDDCTLLCPGIQRIDCYLCECRAEVDIKALRC